MTLADELERLQALHRAGTLTDDEFARAKSRLLDAPPPWQGWSAAVHKWRRSRTDRWLAGVCGGMAAATGVETWFWRLLIAALSLFGGAGLLLYVLLWIFVPSD